jgi:hypothetical protein
LASGQQQSGQQQSRTGQGQQSGTQSDSNQSGQNAQGQGGNASDQNDQQLAQNNDGSRGQPGTRRGGQRSGGARRGGGANNGGYGGDDLANVLDQMLDRNSDAWRGPLTGEDFTPWSDGLRNVEEMVDVPQLRNDIAVARERARLMRQDFKREGKTPDWAVVRLQVLKPLVEVRDSISEELARRQSQEALVPLDRDPVPNRYSELVRKYYEELGKDK